MKRCYLMAIMACFLLMGVSCVHREFEYESSNNAYLEVVFDWCNEPDADPESMSLYLFADEGGLPFRFDFPGRDGGTIRLRPGIYHAVCVNNEPRKVCYRGEESHSTFEITTAEAKALTFGLAINVRSFDLPRASGKEDQLMAEQPPMLWAASEMGFTVEITPAARGRSASQTLTMYPARIVDTYEVTVRNIRNVEYLSALSATISDMSDGYLPGVGKPNDASATLPLELDHDPGVAMARGGFLTFGHCPGAGKSHRLMIYAIMDDGSKYYFEFDVSDQVHNPPDADNVHHIVVEFLDLPIPEGGGEGGGMIPTVEEWQTMDVDLEM